MIKELFIKNYKNTSDPAVREKYGVVAGIFGIITNVILCAMKMVVGLIAGSITIVADAVNNLTDAGSSVLTLIGFRLAGKPADKDHPYGHARYENITALIIALIMFAVGVVFAISSVEKIITPEPIEVTVFTFIILGVAIVGKIYQMCVYLNFSRAIDSKALKASAMDTRNDVLSTLATLIAMIIAFFIPSVNIDAYAGLLVSLFVLVSSIKMISETIGPLLGVIPEKETVDELRNIVLSHEEILGVHDLIIHNYGACNNFATLHAEVDSKGDIIAIHDVIDNIEREVHEKMGIELSIHMDPVDLSNENRAVYHDRTLKVLKEFDDEISFHDFRIVEGETHTNLVFDIVEPFGKHYDVELLKEMLKKEFSPDGTFYFVINVDSKYVD